MAGNHDWGVAGKTNISYFNSIAREAVKWTISQLNPEYKNFLAQLPLKKEEQNFTYTHSTPIDPQEWNYIFSGNEALKNINALEQKVCFIGHSHIPIVFVLTQFVCALHGFENGLVVFGMVVLCFLFLITAVAFLTGFLAAIFLGDVPNV